MASNTDYGFSYVGVGFADINYVVAWSGMCNTTPCTSTGVNVGAGFSELLTQRIDHISGALLDGTAAVGGKVVGGTTHYVERLSLGGRGGISFLLAWWNGTAGGGNYTMTAVRVHGITGSVVGSVQLQSYTNSGPPGSSIAYDGTQFLVATPGCPGAGYGSCGTPTIFGQRVRESDTVLRDSGQGFVISSTGGGTTSTAYDGTNFLVAWPDSRGGTYLARVRPSDGALLDGTSAAAGYQVATTGGAVIAAGTNGRAIAVESRLASDFGVEATRVIVKLITTE